MAKEIDPVVRAWRKSLHCLIHPYLPLMSTLIEMEGKLDAVNGFLATLDASDPEQAARGVAVGELAVKYADKLLDHFGLFDSDDATPPPVNLAQARLLVGNLLAFVKERIWLGRMALGQDDEEADDQTGSQEGGLGTDSLPTTGDQPPPPADAPPLVVDRETFTVRWRGRTCSLGHTKEFLLIEYLSRRPGRFVSVVDLMDEVWEGGDPEPNTVQKTVSNLRGKLGKAGMGDLTIAAERGHYSLKLP